MHAYEVVGANPRGLGLSQGFGVCANHRLDVELAFRIDQPLQMNAARQKVRGYWGAS